MIIYLITNQVNDKQYVGQTTQTLKCRWKGHCSHGTILYSAIGKYGKDNFDMEILDTGESIEELNRKEQKWIKELDTRTPNGYNIEGGGKNSKMAEKTKKKLSKINMGHKHSEETLKKMSEAQKVAQMEPKVRKEKSERMKGNTYCEGRKPWNKGKRTKGYVNCLNCNKDFYLGENSKFCSRECADEYRVGENHPMYGEQHSEEAKEKIGKASEGNSYRAIKVTVHGKTYKSKKNACNDLDWSYGKLQRYLNKGIIWQ